MQLTKNQRYILIGAGAVIGLAVLTGVFFLVQDEPSTSDVAEEATATVEGSWTVEATDTSLPATEAADPPPPPQPSYTRYARVTSVGGMEENWTVDLDFVDIYTGAEADSFAATNGLTVPDNGILFVEGDSTVTMVPLHSSVSIVYKSGSVEALEMKNGTPAQLRAWAYGETEIFPGAVSDLWEVTVENGIATKLEMVAIAD